MTNDTDIDFDLVEQQAKEKTDSTTGTNSTNSTKIIMIVVGIVVLLAIGITSYFVMIPKGNEKTTQEGETKQANQKRQGNNNSGGSSKTDEEILMEILTGIKSIGANISNKFKSEDSEKLKSNISSISNQINSINSLNITVTEYSNLPKDNDTARQEESISFIKNVSACIVACLEENNDNFISNIKSLFPIKEGDSTTRRTLGDIFSFRGENTMENIISLINGNNFDDKKTLRIHLFNLYMFNTYKYLEEENRLIEKAKLLAGSNENSIGIQNNFYNYSIKLFENASEEEKKVFSDLTTELNGLIDE